MSNPSKHSQIKPKDHQMSFRSNRTFTQYNITDFLPPSQPVFSRTSIYRPSRTQPQDSSKPQQSTIPSQEQRLRQQLQASKKRQKEKDATIIQLRQQITEMEKATSLIQSQKQRKIKALAASNCMQLVMLPQHKQLYQVSVQTQTIQIQPVIEIPKLITEKVVHYSGDTQMQQIYMKLDGLKKEKSRTWQGRTGGISDRQMKTDLNKQNRMGFMNRPLSNYMQKEKVKISQQSISILPVHQSKLSEILQAYFD